MMDTYDRTTIALCLAVAAHNMEKATRADLYELNKLFVELIPGEDAVNAASVWAEHVMMVKELRDGIDINNDVVPE